MPKAALRLLVIISILALNISLYGQKSYGGTPEYMNQVPSELQIQPIDLSGEVDIVHKQPKSSYTSNLVGMPIVTAKEPLPNQFEKLGDGHTRIQKIRLGKNTQSYIRFRNFKLPTGARMFVISEQTNQVLGAYTHMNNTPNGRFMCGPIQGNVIIEYNPPQSARESEGLQKANEVPFQIDQIYVNPQPINYGAMNTGFGAAYDCHININCVEGQRFNDQKRGVMRIIVVGEEAIYLCSGSLLNNTAQDGIPYVLSAMHCIEPADGSFTPLFDMWYFDFKYEGPSCANPADEPDFVDVQGCKLIASKSETDMLLLRITGEMPPEANVYYNGWDRREEYLPAQTAIIHHPVGDIKKISHDFDQLQVHQEVVVWNNGTNSPIGTHFINDFDDSVYEPGSSGSALFDETGRVVGQLHGGPLSDKFCTIGIGYSGRLSQSWDGTDPSERLRDWLDPLDNGAMILDGVEADTQEQIVEFEGRVVTPDGIAIPNVEVSLSGDKQTSFFTGSDGRFVFDGLSTKGQYNLQLRKDTNHGNGISAIDIVLMMNHIIGRKELPNVFSKFSADVNLDGNISTVDLVQIMNVIIGRTDRFPNTEAWRFEPQTLQMNGGNIGDLEFSVIGFKMGDLNNSANPRN